MTPKDHGRQNTTRRGLIVWSQVPHLLPALKVVHLHPRPHAKEGEDAQAASVAGRATRGQHVVRALYKQITDAVSIV